MHEVLERIYRSALECCDPAMIARAVLPPSDEPVDVVALGKCATSLFIAAADRIPVARGLIVVPRGYAGATPPGIETVTGGHPSIDGGSLAAGSRLRDFVTTATRPVVVLISGGASACAELSLAPWFTPADVAGANEWLVRSGLPIESMNVVRKHLSAIKGGRLGLALPAGSHTFIYSDVDPEHPEMVGSGPTLPDASTNDDAAAIVERGPAQLRTLAAKLRDPSLPETPKSLAHHWTILADNRTLVDAMAAFARDEGFAVRRVEAQIGGDVEEVAALLVREAATLERREILVAGGEPTVHVTGEGRGGRCSELAVRFARLQLRAGAAIVDGLFGSSDGIDGNSGAAGAVVVGSAIVAKRVTLDAIGEAIAKSDTFRLISAIGRPLFTNPTGNNLRDVIMLARG